MKKIILSIATLFALLQTNAQEKSTEDSAFVSRKLKLEEVNLVSSYYQQDGDHATVTGGIGSEKLTDISNAIDLTLIKYDKKSRKHSFNLELGIDHYTSASSDMVDLQANSSASSADTRFYPSLNWSVENEKKGLQFSAGVSSSTEYDYQSFGGNIGFSAKTKNRMGEFSANFQVLMDQLKLIEPIELRGSGLTDPEKNRNTFAASLSYSQIINEKFQLMLIADIVQQNGRLGLPFHRVYLQDGSVHQEKLPDSRFKLPLGVRANYFLNDWLIVRAFYRYYSDDWKVSSHTADLELPVRISPHFTIVPFYRYYTQTASKYFAGFEEHSIKDEFFTSNYNQSKFDSNFFGAGFRYVPSNGILGIKLINQMEVRYGHYNRSDGLNSNIVSLNLKFKGF